MKNNDCNLAMVRTEVSIPRKAIQQLALSLMRLLVDQSKVIVNIMTNIAETP